MKPIKQLIHESGGVAKFRAKWGVKASTAEKWNTGDRKPNEYALILFNCFEDKEQAQKTVEIQNGDMN